MASKFYPSHIFRKFPVLVSVIVSLKNAANSQYQCHSASLKNARHIISTEEKLKSTELLGRIRIVVSNGASRGGQSKRLNSLQRIELTVYKQLIPSKHTRSSPLVVVLFCVECCWGAPGWCCSATHKRRPRAPIASYCEWALPLEKYI